MRIRKISQSAAIPGKIVNSPSESTTDAYSANYVNELNTYSTTEHRIGTWINRKTNI